MIANLDIVRCPACREALELSDSDNIVRCISCDMNYRKVGAQFDLRYQGPGGNTSGLSKADTQYKPPDKSLWLKKYGSSQLAVDSLCRLIKTLHMSSGQLAVLDIGMFMFNDYCLKPFFEPIRPCLGKYVGVDPSPATFAQYELPTDLYYLLLAFGEYLPVADNLFDLVVSAATFDHLFNPDRCLSEIMRVLKPGGCLYVQLNNTGSWFKRLFRKRAERRRSRASLYHNYFWNVSQFTDFLTNRGFVIDQKWCYRYTPPLDNPEIGSRMPYHFHVTLCQIFDWLGNAILPGLGGNFVILSHKPRTAF